MTDEALEKAKDCLKDGTITSTAIDYIETLIPELKESEDERISTKRDNLKLVAVENKTESVDEVEKAAFKHVKNNYNPWLYKSLQECFIAGAKWMESQYKRVGGEPEDWYEYKDTEYMWGFRFDEPVELPCEVYIKKKE